MSGKNKEPPAIPPAVLRNFLGLNFLFGLVFFLLSLGWRYFHSPAAVPAVTIESGRERPGLWEMKTDTAKNLLHRGLPLLQIHRARAGVPPAP